MHLIPVPRRLTPAAGRFSLPRDLYIAIQPHPATRDLFAAERFIIEAEPLTGSSLHIVIGQGTDPAGEIRVRFDQSIAPGKPDAIRDQAYRLHISPAGITLSARAPAGVFYAFQTLLQIIREAAYTRLQRDASTPHSELSNLDSEIASPRSKSPNRKPKIKSPRPLSLPCLAIEDFPDFDRRGVYHDTARGKVPTVDTLLQLIDDLAHLKYNEFQLYIENNFQFRKHPDMYNDTDPFTAEELLLLESACRARHMEFVPSLTSLGHFEKILSRPRYRSLAEAEPAQLKAIGAPCWHEDAPWSLCVTDPKARQLLKDMYEEFAPNFSSRQFNICCDEAYDLGRVRSKKLADKIGTGKMYVDWIRYCDQLAQTGMPAGQKRSVQMWGDIILNHPDLIAQLPPDATLLEWGYEHDHKFEEHCALFARRLAPPRKNATLKMHKSFYVAPGTSSWLTLSARTRNAFGNIHNAAAAGLRHGARGILVTDWGDHGHQQLLAVSLTPFAYGAAAAWNLAATPNPLPAPSATPRKSTRSQTLAALLRAISLHLFQDPSATFAQLAYDLGLTYERLGWQRFNGSLDHFLFREKWDFANYVNRAPAAGLTRTLAACQKLIPQFQLVPLLHPDAGKLAGEMLFTCDEIIHTCGRTQLRQEWLAADPAKRNPEEETLRSKPPVPLPKSFRSEIKALAQDAHRLEKRFASLWLSRNKRSRLADVLAEFQRLAREYQSLA